jgi:hypothetical protein
MGTMRDEYFRLLGLLKKSVPFFSMRYQGHMNWDLTFARDAGLFRSDALTPQEIGARSVAPRLIGKINRSYNHLLGVEKTKYFWRNNQCR